MLYNFQKNNFSSLNFTDIHFVCNIPANSLEHALKTLRGVDVTKYALAAIIQYVQLSKIG